MKYIHFPESFSDFLCKIQSVPGIKKWFFLSHAISFISFLSLRLVGICLLSLSLVLLLLLSHTIQPFPIFQIFSFLHISFQFFPVRIQKSKKDLNQTKSKPIQTGGEVEQTFVYCFIPTHVGIKKEKRAE